MKYTGWIRASILALPLVLAAAPARAAAPGRPAASSIRPRVAHALRRAVVATAMVGATGVAMAAPESVEAPPPPLDLTYVAPSQPSYAALAREQLKNMGVPVEPLHFDTVGDKIQGGLLGPLHKIAERKYFETGSDAARLARLLTDSSQMKYTYGIKSHAWSITYKHKF